MNSKREQQVKYMVGRFLNWKLPTDFRPDAGISFNPISNEGTPYAYRLEPSGTNLFDAQQAEAMVRYMLDGLPGGTDDPTITDQAEREKFEAYFGELRWPMARIDNPSGYVEYMDQGTHKIWMGWQSRAELDGGLFNTFGKSRDRFRDEMLVDYARTYKAIPTPSDVVDSFNRYIDVTTPQPHDEAPIDMLLFCPTCGVQHIDEPDDNGWTNPPHRSHLCCNCGSVWRPSDHATNGVAAIKTKGRNDTVSAHPRNGACELAAIELIRRGKEAVNAAIQQASHELQGHDRSADKCDAIVQSFRQDATAFINAFEAHQKGVGLNQLAPSHDEARDLALILYMMVDRFSNPHPLNVERAKRYREVFLRAYDLSQPDTRNPVQSATTGGAAPINEARDNNIIDAIHMRLRRWANLHDTFIPMSKEELRAEFLAAQKDKSDE